jgi:NAD+ synthase (glutamine-hydrolysing)
MVNQAGGLDGITFDGHSTVFDKNGEIVKRGKGFAEDFFTVDLAKQYKTIAPCGFDEHELIFNALVCNLKDFIKKIGAKKVHFGLSGGVDSALVAVLAKFAFGKENVTGIMLPSPYSSKSSIEDSVMLAKNLNISLKKIDISSSFREIYQTVEQGVGKVKGLTEENMQARIRGLLLMAYSNNENSILLNTGNKSEFAVGYATIYGDMCGALSVIGDLYKTKVYELCYWINKNFNNVIPENILTKAPSAELRPNQKDEDSLPPYDVLDKIIELYMEENKSMYEITEITKTSMETVKKVIKLLLKAEFKRKQAPPILKVTDKAFVSGFRYPISAGFNPFEI